MDLIKISTYLYVIFFITAGLNHFLNPVFYDSLVPKFLPFPRQVHQLTGVIEIILPLFLLTKYKPQAALLMVIFLIVIYGANLYVWIEGIPYGNRVLTNLQHIFRLVLQIAYIAFTYIIYHYD